MLFSAHSANRLVHGTEAGRCACVVELDVTSTYGKESIWHNGGKGIEEKSKTLSGSLPYQGESIGIESMEFSVKPGILSS